MSRQTPAKFIWADKLALAFTLFAGTIWAAFWALAYLTIGEQGTAHLWQHFGMIGTQAGILGAMSVWLMLRLTDLAAGGTTYRLGVNVAREWEAAIARGAQQAAKHLHHRGPQIAR